MIEIRRLRPDDWELQRDARLAALRDAPYAFASTVEREAAFDEWQWRARLEQPTSAAFAAVEGGVPVGLVAGVTDRTEPVLELQLIGMWVRDSARGSGVADRLVAEMLAWARDRRAAAVVLWVAEGNARAYRFYRRFGFTSTGVRQPMPRDPSTGEEQLRLAL